VGLFGGWLIAEFYLGLSARQYWSSAWQALDWKDVAEGLIKPFLFALVIALIGCFYGLRASGGTQGVGKATTNAMVASTLLIFILDVMVTKLFV
jgi:phospholipid/cholesterol/gamma-HCH transport system permease protein